MHGTKSWELVADSQIIFASPTRVPSDAHDIANPYSQSYLFTHNVRFFEDWHLDLSFTLCTASWTILILSAASITLSALYLPEEGDYELIPEYPETQQDEQ